MNSVSLTISRRTQILVCAILITVASYFTYFRGYEEPAALFWDETYHVAAAQKYLNGEFFLEPHPPLGKMFIALGEYLLAPNERTDYFKGKDKGGGDKLPPGFSFAGYRLFPTLFGWLTAPLIFLTALILTQRIPLALLSSALYAFDNAMIVHARSAMLDSTQLFFITATLLTASLLAKNNLTRGVSLVVSILLGVSGAAVVLTKINGAVVLLLLPLPLIIKHRQLTLRLVGSFATLIAFFTVYFGVWYLHFRLADPETAKTPSNPSYIKDPTTAEIVARSEIHSLSAFPSLWRDAAIGYIGRYTGGVPKLDLCKPSENGSPAYLWPIGARTIQYRWQTAENNTARYLYLVPNPFTWSIGLLSVITASGLLFARMAFMPLVRLKQPRLLALLTVLYGGYMLGMTHAPRVMYLYHYFVPLILSYVLASIVLNELERIGRVKLTERRKALCAFACIGGSLVSFLWYSPFTYYKPISDDQIRARALFDVWDLRCSGCPRTNHLAQPPGGPILLARLTINGLAPTSAKQSWGNPRVDISVTDKPLEVRGVAYPRAFGMHSKAELVYKTNKKYSRFTADAGLPDYLQTLGGSVTFSVEGDGKVLWESTIIKPGDPIQNVDVDISSVSTLTLKIGDAGDGITHDHGFWANLKLTGKSN